MSTHEQKGNVLGSYSAMNENQIRSIKKETGKPVIGYLCCFAPPEIISAAGALPYRISGLPGKDHSAAEKYVEPYGCTYVLNILARAVNGEFDFLNGLIISHSCDMVQRLYGIWTYYQTLSYRYMFNVPHQVTPWAQRFFMRELGFFRESLEKFTGKKVTPAGLKETIAHYNMNRARVRKLYALRRPVNPTISGSKMLALLMSGGALPVERFGALLEETLKEIEIESAAGPVNDKRPRLLVWGSIIDDPALYKMIEEAGGDVVTDDTCIGFRTWEKDVPVTDNPDEGLMEHYFLNFQCPRTDRGPGTGRFAYILERAREYNVDGIIAYSISFCDPHKFDYPDLRDYMKKHGLPMLLIDDNYSFEPAGAIRTRLQAFMEMIGG